MDLAELNYVETSTQFALKLIEIIKDAKKNSTIENIEDITFFVDNIKQKAITYAQIRQDWEYYSIEQKREEDESRTIKHNAFIDSVNMFLRFLKKTITLEKVHKETNELLEKFESMDRKQKGDIACYLACLVAISNR